MYTEGNWLVLETGIRHKFFIKDYTLERYMENVRR